LNYFVAALVDIACLPNLAGKGNASHRKLYPLPDPRTICRQGIINISGLERQIDEKLRK
jgi:hypothetical protein